MSRKSVHAKLCLSGRSGENGQAGSSGSAGAPGRRGDRAGRGTDGSDGQPGEPGADASNGMIHLHGTAAYLHVRLQTCRSDLVDEEEHRFQLGRSKKVILIEAIGGNGGTGGRGGEGGRGGDGGQGAHGDDGADGSETFIHRRDSYHRMDTYSHNYMEDNGSGSYSRHAEGASGSNGYGFGFGPVTGSDRYQRSLEMTQRANDFHRLHDRSSHFNSDHYNHRNAIGGSGRDGERGGDGGSGAQGGDGGRGGRGGKAGAGGHLRIYSADPRLFMLVDVKCRAGEAGKGGRGGAGGNGGAGGRGGSGGKGGRSGYGRSSGKDGATGRSGSHGKAGESGGHGPTGPTASNGSVEFIVTTANGDTIETGAEKYHARVYDYQVTDGNHDGIYEPQSNILISNVRWTNSGQLHLPSGSILSFPSTNEITSDAKDLSILSDADTDETFVDNHPFTCHIGAPSLLPINEPYIQPIRLASQITLLNRAFTGGALERSITCQYPIQIQNIEVPTVLGLNERATVRLTFENISSRPYGLCSESAGSIKFVFSTPASLRLLPLRDDYDYRIISPGQTEYLCTTIVPPNSTKQLLCECMLKADAPYETLVWTVDLMLRDVPIERHTNQIRLVPAFEPTRFTDALLVTNSQTKREEYLAYQTLFQLFDYSFQTWDLERYGAFHHPELVWLRTANLIVFIHSKPYATFAMMKSHLLLGHMRLSDNAGFICLGDCLPDELDFALFDYHQLHHLDEKSKKKAEGAEQANSLRNDFEKRDDHQFLYQIVYEPMVHGNKYVHRSTLNFHVGNRLVLVHCEDPSLIVRNIPSKPPSQNPDTILRDSLFGRLCCALLSCYDHGKSLEMIRQNSRLCAYTFNSTTISFNIEHLLVSHFMSLIERECNRGSVQLYSSERCLAQMVGSRGQRGSSTEWASLLAQALQHYIDHHYKSTVPWRVSKTRKKQRKKLEQFLKALRSISPRKVSDNHWLHPPMQMLRLQHLGELQFPASDSRAMCVRTIDSILPWKLEQKSVVAS